MREIIENILQRWFLSEPALFGVMCLHNIIENSGMTCPVRVGRWEPSTSGELLQEGKVFPRQLEYNPDILRTMRDDEIEEAFRCEAIRILLKHPYSRIPDNCSQTAVTLGSNLTVGDNYDFRHIDMETPSDFGLSQNMSYEWYSRKIQENADEQGSIRDYLEGNSQEILDISEKWGEDVIATQLIDGVIRDCERNNGWGSLSGALAEKIAGGVRSTVNWRNILAGFRSSILSQKRSLTRMRPSRRFGFEQMGSRRDFTTKLLVAMDVSGSISSKDIKYFLGVVNSAFRYGFESVDLVQIDTEIKTVVTVRKAIDSIIALGRGGTSFQPAIDYAESNGYDGLVVLTDGYAREPRVSPASKLKIAWVCVDKKCYEDNFEMLSRTGKVCVMQMDYQKN